MCETVSVFLECIFGFFEIIINMCYIPKPDTKIFDLRCFIRGFGFICVWVHTEAGPCKIAAIGIRVSSKGITSHGFALNIAPDMSHFSNIVPCGIEKHGVTSLSILLARPIQITEILASIVNAFSRIFNVETSFIG